MKDNDDPDRLAAMMLNPYRHFSTPMDVVRDNTLTKREKLGVLRSMQCDAEELQMATEENMAGGKHRSLSDVRDAIRAVEADDTESQDGTGTATHDDS